MFFTPEEDAMIQWVKNNTGPEDIMLGDLKIGNMLPGQTGRRVFMGHGVETLFFYTRYYQAQLFFQGHQPLEQKISFLKKEGISIVIFDLEKHHDHIMIKDQDHIIWKNKRFAIWKE